MEASTNAKEDKDNSNKRSSSGVLQKVIIFLVVLAICVGFFVGLELFRQRMTAVEATVNRLSEAYRNDHHQGKPSSRSLAL